MICSAARKAIVGAEPLPNTWTATDARVASLCSPQMAGTSKASSRASGIYHASYAIMSVPTPATTENDWVRRVLFEQGYLARIPGDSIKVYLAMIEACGGLPDRSVTISLKLIMQRTRLSCPTVIDSLARLEGAWACGVDDSPAWQGKDLLRG